MDDYEKIKGAIEEIVEAIKNIAETIKGINEEIAELFAEVVFEEREKYKPCLCVPLPPPSYRSVKLWRKNKAIFRPYRQDQKGGENMRSEEAFMNYFKAAEQVLSSVPILERANENLKRREARLIESGAPREPGAIDYSKPFTDSHYVNDTLGELLAVAECERNIAKNNSELAYIYGIVEQLQDEHKKLVRLWYFEKRSKESVMEELYIESLSTVYNLRNKAVAEFALLYYGASALPSI